MMPQQRDLFDADPSWVHFFRSLVMGGDVARMGSALTVYIVVKAYANHTTGYAAPTISKIAEQAGLSPRQVVRHIQTLVDLGYLVNHRVGRNNHYQLREKVLLLDAAGEVGAVATWDYIPAAVRDATAELRDYRQTGRHSGQVIHIDRLILTLGNNNSVNIAESQTVRVDTPPTRT